MAKPVFVPFEIESGYTYYECGLGFLRSHGDAVWWQWNPHAEYWMAVYNKPAGDWSRFAGPRDLDDWKPAWAIVARGR